MGFGLTKTCKSCGKNLVKAKGVDGPMVFLECPDCRIIWDYYYKRRKVDEFQSR